MNKIKHYFSTLELTRALGISLLGSLFIYLKYWGYSSPLLNTLLGILALYLLLASHTKVWFLSGAFIGLFWFWWIALSLIHYEMLWAAPIEIFIIMLSYGMLFTLISWISTKASSFIPSHALLLSLSIKALGLLLLSYVHPFSFDWFKPELLFVESYVGITKLSFSLILLSLVLSIWRKSVLYLVFILLAYETPNNKMFVPTPSDITLATTYTKVQDKWDKNKHPKQFEAVFKRIDQAILENKKLIIFPESIFPIFLNRSEELLEKLEAKALDISIVIGALYWDGTTPRNSTYIFTKHKLKIANKVLLVPFGEANPLPDFLSTWVNKLFYDGGIDYKASANITDYTIDTKTYRNAICFEATSEKLYQKDARGKHPSHMIVLSNNGWFHPSIEPTLQKLLLLYYSRKYATTIYHAVNMSESYVIQAKPHSPKDSLSSSNEIKPSKMR